MSDAPADMDARIAALDPERSFIVQAPAGSGKTELLTRRVLTLLSRVEEPEQVLAITFTRKAAAEMRHRVVQALRQAADGVEPANAYEAEGLALARSALLRDAERGWRLLEDPGRLAMRTIDSLATHLAHRLPVMSSLGAAVSTTDDARALHVEAAERFLDHHLEIIPRVALQRDNRLEQVRDLLADLLAVRDQWQDYVQEDLDDGHLRALLQSMLDEVVVSRLEAATRAAPPLLGARMEASLRRAAALLVARADVFDEPLTEEQRGVLALAEEAGTLPPADIEHVKAWGSLGEFLLTKSTGGVRKTLTKAIGFPAKGEAKKLDLSADDLVAHKSGMLEILESLTAHPVFVARLNETRSLPGLAYGEDDWELLGQLARGLRVLLAELQLVYRERREVDFIEISARARQALGSDEQPTDLALSMDLRIRHMLVDEFQDVSHAQFSLFARLVAEWNEPDGRTFFAVGDPMQSIYRFREGDVALFLQAIDAGIGPVKLHYLRLSVNFRSMPTIIDWINDRFGAAFPRRSDRDIGAVTYETSEAHLQGEGGVTVHALERAESNELSSQREGEHVGHLVAEALAENPEQTIGVLIRARSHASAIIAALQARAIPFRALEIERLGTRPVVLDLIALSHALCYPHDRLSWLALLRGPMCGLRLADLHALVSSSEQQPLMSLMSDPARQARLSMEGRARLERFLAIMEPAAEQAPRGAIVPWLEAAWLQLGGPAACASDIDLEVAERCISRLASLEREGLLRRRRTVEADMQRLFAGDAGGSEARVQLMTLHKSKGLEFDTVILPALGRDGQKDRARLMEWFRTDGERGSRLLLAPIDKANAPPLYRNPVGRLLKGFRDRAAEAERLRLFYVACTRARRRLLLVATLRSDEEGRPTPPPSGSLLAPLWPSLGEQVEFVEADRLTQGSRAPEPFEPEPLSPRSSPGEPSEPATLELDLAPRTEDSSRSLAPPFMRSVAGWTLPAAPRFQWAVRPADKPLSENIAYDWQATTARDVGTVVHRLLQRLAEVEPARRVAPSGDELIVIARELRTLGVTEAMLGEAVDQVARAVGNTLDSDRGRWLLDPGHHDARSEWAVSIPVLRDGDYAGVRRVIIDRSFVDAEGTRWIVDYKTGSHEGGNLEGFLDRELTRYASQLEGYADVFARIDPGRTLRMGLYFPLVQGWREHRA